MKLYATLISCTEEDAFRICHSVKDGNGLEAIRLLMMRYEPKNPGTKRAILKAIINNQPAKKAEDIEGNLMAVEELMKKYEAIARDNLPEDLKVRVIIDLRVKDLKDHLELTTKDLSYKDVRDEILSYVERKRDVFGKQVTAMEVDSHEETEHWGGGDWNDMYGESTGDIEGEMYSFQRVSKRDSVRGRIPMIMVPRARVRTSTSGTPNEILEIRRNWMPSKNRNTKRGVLY